MRIKVYRRGGGLNDSRALDLVLPAGLFIRGQSHLSSSDVSASCVCASSARLFFLFPFSSSWYTEHSFPKRRAAGGHLPTYLPRNGAPAATFQQIRHLISIIGCRFEPLIQQILLLILANHSQEYSRMPVASLENLRPFLLNKGEEEGEKGAKRERRERRGSEGKETNSAHQCCTKRNLARKGTYVVTPPTTSRVAAKAPPQE